MQKETLKRHQRIKSRKEINLFFKNKKMVSSKCMQMWIVSGEKSSLKLCVAAGQVFGKAVKRNRAKRLLRELFRRMRSTLEAKYDILLIARKPILKENFENLKKEFINNAEKLGIKIKNL